MTEREIEGMLRVFVGRYVFEVLSAISAPREAYALKGPYQPAPMKFEIPGFKIEVDIEVRSA